MSRDVRNVLLGVAVAAIVGIAVGVSISGAQAEDIAPAARAVDIVLIRCGTDSAKLSLTAYEGSTRAPARKSDSCSENISLVLREGFTIKDIGHYDLESDYMLITLVK